MDKENQVTERHKLIYANMSLGVLEIRIREAIKSCDIWGDLGLTKDEYGILTDKITNYKHENVSHLRFDDLFSHFPFSMVTHAIFFALYDFNDDFWRTWAEKISLDFGENGNNYYSKAGKNILQIFINQNFEVFEDDGLKYVTPILSQAGIPNSSLYDLFDEMSMIKNAAFDPQELILELQTSRSHMVRQPVRRFFKFQREKAIKLLLDIYEIVDGYDSGSSGLTNDDARVFEQYSIWKELCSTRVGRKLLQRDKYPGPRIIYCDDGRGVAMVLPSVDPKNEYALEMIWEIKKSKIDMQTVSCKLHRTADRCCTREILIPIECGKEYEIKLKEDIDNNTIQEWIIRDLNTSAIIFDQNGRLQIDGYLPSSTGYLVVNEENCSLEFQAMNYSTVYMPAKSEYRAYYFAPQNAKSCIILNSGQGKRVIQCRSSLKVSFESRYTLFDEKANATGLSLFTRFPKLKFEEYEKVLMQNLSIILVHKQTGEKKTLELSQIKEGEDYHIVDISQMIDRDTPLYGIYDVRFYERGSFRKRASFVYGPNIKYDDSRINLWPTKNANTTKTELLIKPQENVKFIFDTDVTVDNEYINGETWTKIQSFDSGIYLNGVVDVECENYKFSVPFRKTVKNMQWAFWQEGSNEYEICKSTRRLFINDLMNSPTNLLLSMHRDAFLCDPQIALYSKDKKLLQIVDVNAASNGKFCLPLSSFATTMESYNPPFDVVFKYQCSGAIASTVLAQICEPVILQGLQYQKDDETNNIPVLKWTKKRTNYEAPMVLRGVSILNFELPIDPSECKLDLFGNCFIQLNCDLKPGIYKVDYCKEEDFFFDNAEFLPPLLSKQNMLYVDRKSIISDLTSVTKIFRNALAFFDDEKYLKQLLPFIYKYSDKILTKVVLATAFFLASLIINYQESHKYESIGIIYQDLVRYINRYIFNDKQRGQIMKYLIQLNLSEKNMNFCIDELNLFMFSISEESRLTEDELRCLYQSNKRLGLLWYIRQKGDAKDTAEKILSVIGSDPIKEILSFTTKGCSTTDWDACFDKFAVGSCPKSCAKLKLTNNYCGDSEVFRSMFEWGSRYKEPLLVLEKKPDNQIYFAGQQYLDLLISWYYRNVQVSSQTHKKIEHIMRFRKSIDGVQNGLSKNAFAVISKYLRANNCRNLDDAGGFYPFFYYISLSCLHAYLNHNAFLDDGTYKNAEWFLLESMDLISELVIHDLLAVEVYMYLSERENK